MPTRRVRLPSIEVKIISPDVTAIRRHPYQRTFTSPLHHCALEIAATSAGYPVRFWQTAQLVARLGKAKREGTLDRLLADVAKARLLVLDEFGPVPFDVDGARQLYQVMPEGHGRRGAAFATSVESGRRGTDFADKRLAAAIVDRVVHHGRLVEFGGSSRRLEESSMLGKGARRRPRGSSRGRPPTWRKARFASGGACGRQIGGRRGAGRGRGGTRRPRRRDTVLGDTGAWEAPERPGVAVTKHE